MGFRALEDTPKQGRPRLLEVSPELTEVICEALEDGMFVREAAALAGVTVDSVYRWIREGTRDKRDGKETPESEFSDAIKIAMASAEREALQAIRTAGMMPQFWPAKAWFLERRYPEKYGRKDRVEMEHSGQQGLGVANVDNTLSERLDDESKREAAKEIARNLAIIGKPDDGSKRGAGNVRESSDEWEIEDSESLSLPEWETD